MKSQSNGRRNKAVLHIALCNNKESLLGVGGKAVEEQERPRAAAELMVAVEVEDSVGGAVGWRSGGRWR
uniref:Uncharacterized protein n=1 Tax=Arundo donax TaxID=35708 RepID=A0A0A8XVT6_ARUDO